MTQYDIKNTINSLVKVAEQMIDNADAPQKASPEEVLQGLEGIIAQLEQVAASIPAQAAEPSAPQAPQSPTEPTPAVAKLEKQVADLTQILEAKDREEIAKETASYFTDSKTAQEKYNEIVASKEPISVLKAQLEVIAEYAENQGVAPQKHAKTESFSYVRTAKQNTERMYNL